jgi:hypothetical protein
MDGENMTKFMQSLKPHWERRLRRMAKKRGITLQELLRAAVIPEWYSHQPKELRG